MKEYFDHIQKEFVAAAVQNLIGRSETADIEETIAGAGRTAEQVAFAHGVGRCSICRTWCEVKNLSVASGGKVCPNCAE